MSAEFTSSQQRVVNLIAIDAPRISEFASKQYVFVHIFVTLTIAVVTLARLLSLLSLLIGLLAPIILMPLNMAASGKYAVAQGHLMSKRDAKMRIMSKALQAIRQIKYAATEPRWLAWVMGARHRRARLSAQSIPLDNHPALLLDSITHPAFRSRP